jgi:hypothetical protein
VLAAPGESPVTEEQKNGETQRNIADFLAFGRTFR